MFIHSSKFLYPVATDQQQPNATDITIDRLFAINEFDNFVLYKDGRKKMRDRKEIFAVEGIANSKTFRLKPGQYQFECNAVVTIPENVVGWVVGRSTLTRNGIFITSGLYDSGFNADSIGGIIFVHCVADIEQGTRIAQFITANAETFHLYNGQYQKTNGI